MVCADRLSFVGVQQFELSQEEFEALEYFCGTTIHNSVRYCLLEPVLLFHDFENLLEAAKEGCRVYRENLELEKKKIQEKLEKREERTREKKLRKLEKLKKELNVE